jgi:hypothetical protein
MTARLMAPRKRPPARRRYSRTRHGGSLATRLGLYGRDTRYRIPDARCRYGYRLAPGGERARLRLRISLCAWIAFLIAGIRERQDGRPVPGIAVAAAGTVLLVLYAWHRWRVNHRLVLPDAGFVPAGETRERKPIPREIKAAVWRRDGGRCRHCGISDSDAVAAYGVHLHYDHIVPFSRNGTDTVNNLQLLCEKDNLAKSNKYVG